MKEKVSAPLKFVPNNTINNPLLNLSSKKSSKPTCKVQLNTKTYSNNKSISSNGNSSATDSLSEIKTASPFNEEFNPLNMAPSHGSEGKNIFDGIPNLPTVRNDCIMQQQTPSRPQSRLSTSSFTSVAKSVLGHARGLQSFARQAATSILNSSKNDSNLSLLPYHNNDVSLNDQRFSQYCLPLHGKVQNAWVTKTKASEKDSVHNITVKCNWCSYVYSVVTKNPYRVCYILPDQFLPTKLTGRNSCSTNTITRLDSTSDGLNVADSCGLNTSAVQSDILPLQLYAKDTILLAVQDCLCRCSEFAVIKGTLILTQCCLIFQLDLDSQTPHVFLGTQWLHLLNYYSVSYSKILKVTHKSPSEFNITANKKNMDLQSCQYMLKIDTKDCRSMKFYLCDQNVHRLLNYHLNENSFKETFVFYYQPIHPKQFIYDPIAEWNRFIDVHKPFLRISNANENYLLSPTYPKYIVTLNVITDQQLIKIANFRTKQRFPIFSWGAFKQFGTLWRSSQPKSMFQRCSEDELMLSTIANYHFKDENNHLLIIDARPYINAVANKASGGGFENTGNIYKFCRLEFGNIQNIHHVYDSWQQMEISVKNNIPLTCRTNILKYTLRSEQLLQFPTVDNDPIETCPHCDSNLEQDSKPFLVATSEFPFWCSLSTKSQTSTTQTHSDFLQRIAHSQWYNSIQLLLKATTLAVSQLEQGLPVLIHCSDGWDRTSQIVALTMLCVDPYYRTLQGLMVLLEQEFLHAGHPFHTRCQHLGQFANDVERNVLEEDELSISETASAHKKFSPIFIQWLDCVFQLITQFPYAFEYNVDLINLIASEIYNCLYGTFLLNCSKEREYFLTQTKCASIWDAILDCPHRFIQKAYESSAKATLYPDLSRIQVWESYWFRYMPQGLNILSKTSI